MITNVLLTLTALFFLFCFIESKIALASAEKRLATIDHKYARREAKWNRYADHMESSNIQLRMIITSIKDTSKAHDTTIAKLGSEIAALKAAKQNQQQPQPKNGNDAKPNNGNGKPQPVTQPTLTGLDMSTLGAIMPEEQKLIDMWQKQNTAINVITERIQARRNKATKAICN